MSKRARLLVVLLVLVAGGVFLYPTFNWYYMVPQDQKELAAGSKEQIQAYARGRASRDLVELKDLVAKDQDSGMPDKFSFLADKAEENYKLEKQDFPDTWSIAAVLNSLGSEKSVFNSQIVRAHV